uniref:Pentatricopeptide repeat-containing protein n=1 Tax=Chenopodium quinoa TaxID=63459 RepID=A0A803KRK4_CHEQI
MAVAIANFPKLSVHSRHFYRNPSLTVNNDRYFAEHPLLLMVDRCTKSSQLKQIHAQLLRIGLFFDPYSSSKLFSALAISPMSDLDYAQKMFDEIPQPNLYTWNTLIRAYASSDDDPVRSLFVFLRMLHECPDLPNKFTFPFVIKAASDVVDDAKLGRGIHGMVVKLELADDLFILNSLIRFYSACGYLDLAYRVFMSIHDKDVVSWNSMLNAYVQGGCPEMALELYQAMEGEDVRPNEVTMVGVVSACSKTRNLELGRVMHSHIRKNRIKSNLTLRNAILDMYMKCASVEDARKLFDEMERKM